MPRLICSANQYLPWDIYIHEIYIYICVTNINILPAKGTIRRIQICSRLELGPLAIHFDYQKTVLTRGDDFYSFTRAASVAFVASCNNTSARSQTDSSSSGSSSLFRFWDLSHAYKGILPVLLNLALRRYAVRLRAARARFAISEHLF